MSNLTITHIDQGGVVIGDSVYADDTLTFAGTDTFAPGTILARSTATDKLVLYVKGGSSNGNGIPKAIITYEVSRTGAGDLPVRALITGKVRKDKLVIDADGDDSNVDAVVLDLLRDYGLVTQPVSQLNIQDNEGT